MYDEALQDFCWDVAERVVGHGTTSTVFEVPNSQVVIKTPEPHELECFEMEKKIYTRLLEGPGHPRIVQCLAIRATAIFLERLSKTLHDRLREAPSPDLKLRIRWAIDAAEGLAFLHSRNILQADVSTHNMMLDRDEHLKYIDFSGSSIDGEHGSIFYGARNASPYRDPDDETVDVASEVFALGSVLYEIESGREPYEELERD